MTNNGTKQIPPLKETVSLFIDKSPESKKAVELLEQSGLKFWTTEGPVEPYQIKPLLIDEGGGTHEGLPGIIGYLSLLEFWSNQPFKSSVFK